MSHASQGSMWSNTGASNAQFGKSNMSMSEDVKISASRMSKGGPVPVLNFAEFPGVQRGLGAEEDIRPSIKGVISICVKSARFGQTDKMINHSAFVYCSITTRNFVKKTRVVRGDDGRAAWNQRKLFPVTVPRHRKHPYNLVNVQVFSVDPSDLDNHTERGSVAFHLHDIIPVSPISGIFDLWDETSLMGDISLEITYNYGTFGYGQSVQLHEDRVNPEDLIRYSLFPRINPLLEETESEVPVLAVKAIPHPRYIPFKTPIYLSYGKEIGATLLNTLAETQTPLLMTGKETEISEFQEKYYDVNDRAARLLMLHRRLAATSAPKETIATSVDPIDDGAPIHTYMRYVKPVVALSARRGDHDFLAVAKRRVTNAFVGDNEQVVIAPAKSHHRAGNYTQDALRKLRGGGASSWKDKNKVHPM